MLMYVYYCRMNTNHIELNVNEIELCQFIDSNIDKINWNSVVKYNHEIMSSYFIKKYEKYIPFNVLFYYTNRISELLPLFKDNFDGSLFCKRKDLDLDTIMYVLQFFEDDEPPGFAWEHLTGTYFSVEFCRMFKDYIPYDVWTCISIKHKSITKEFAHEFANYIDWELVNYLYLLDPQFLREHKDYVDWYVVCTEYYLSEEEIIYNIDLLRWKQVSMTQVLSIDFVIQYKQHLVLEDLLLNDSIPKETRTKISELYKGLQCTYPICNSTTETCTICMEEEGTLHSLPCNHVFHGECISSWTIRQAIPSCPLCRHQL